MAYDPVKGEVFVSEDIANAVAVISDSSNSLVATIPVGTFPTGSPTTRAKGRFSSPMT